MAETVTDFTSMKQSFSIRVALAPLGSKIYLYLYHSCCQGCTSKCKSLQ